MEHFDGHFNGHFDGHFDGHPDHAAFAGESLDDFHATAALAQAADYAQIHEDLDAADEELFEDDLLSLITSRPSRQVRQRAARP